MSKWQKSSNCLPLQPSAKVKVWDSTLCPVISRVQPNETITEALDHAGGDPFAILVPSLGRQMESKDLKTPLTSKLVSLASQKMWFTPSIANNVGWCMSAKHIADWAIAFLNTYVQLLKTMIVQSANTSGDLITAFKTCK